MGTDKNWSNEQIEENGSNLLVSEVKAAPQINGAKAWSEIMDASDESDPSLGEQSFVQDSDFTREKVRGQRPIRHQQTYYKMVEWSVEVKKPIL